MHIFYTVLQVMIFGQKYAATRILAMLLLLAVALAGCKDYTRSTASSQEVIEKTWVLAGGSVVKDGVDITGDHSGLILTFDANGTYTNAPTDNLFESAGIWVWADAGATALVLDGVIKIDVLQLTATDLHLEFTRSENPSSARVTSIAGHYIVKLRPGSERPLAETNWTVPVKRNLTN
jgi:hypothetical protein